ncbi:FIG00873775: hypothetical protein [Richelia intracellularis]|nr:FIG00873775: hypothetical protein [Richelia intracellularis]
MILVELFRLLIDYLQEHRIYVGAAVEITIVSALREIILRGVLEIPREQIIGVSVFILVLGGLLVIFPWIYRILALTTSIRYIGSETTNQNNQDLQ